jgi:protein ariadne-2
MSDNESENDKETLDEEEGDEEDVASDFDNYYKLNEFEVDLDYIHDYEKDNDPEYFEYECLQIEEVERLLNESVEDICKSLGVSPSLAKV